LFKKELIWHEFKLIITDPPRYSGHFRLIKNELIPFVEKNKLHFWVTNYFGANSDYVLFRLKIAKSQSDLVHNFLNDLKEKRLIVNWQFLNWDPKYDAQTRIGGLRQRISGFDPSLNAIVGYDSANNRILVSSNTNIQERQAQLASLFEALGECTRVIYGCLDSKPEDLWLMSVFVHLVLNSLDFSGPDPPSEEHSIRSIPPL
jgi:hypothetical protein